eukprot:s5309_g3.t1
MRTLRTTEKLTAATEAFLEPVAQGEPQGAEKLETNRLLASAQAEADGLFRQIRRVFSAVERRNFYLQLVAGRWSCVSSMAPGWLGSLLNWPFRCIGQRSLPETHGVFEAELDRPMEAELLRDEYGVPHIFAATEHEHDFFFLNGVVHAQDRLWQMHSGRMLAAGRLCEMVGRKALDLDRFLRQLGLRQLAEEDLQHLRDCGLPDSLLAALCRTGSSFHEGVACRVN